MKAKIVLCDDDGNVLPNTSSAAYDFELGAQTLDEIDQAVEQFCCQALPELEANILQSAQQHHMEDFQKQDESPSTALLMDSQ